MASASSALESTLLCTTQQGQPHLVFIVHTEECRKDSCLLPFLVSQALREPSPIWRGGNSETRNLASRTLSRWEAGEQRLRWEEKTSKESKGFPKEQLVLEFSTTTSHKTGGGEISHPPDSL